MRIISGTARSRRIGVPKSVTRPSTDRLREALFSILGARVHGAAVLDLFAGSGALGLEALSRGAASAVFVDESKDARRVIERNLSDLGMEGGCMVAANVISFLKGDRGGYDIVFADPPYRKNPGDRDFVAGLLEHERLPERLREDGLLVIEDDPSNKRGDVRGWELLDQRKYGGCGILFYQWRRNR